ncbi:rna polymerase [Holotrichia oblita]|uniref:Rna polymerase n=1 Tax=Holotrichia oblita TaxID=644536 RepID=A0ACB9T3W3_HOLOL|nr:rna polymerase [Holotrichia oblita]
MCNELPIQHYSDIDFISQFRLSRTSVKIIIASVGDSYIENRRPRISVNEAVLLTIWTLANEESFREIADRFGISRGRAHKAFVCVCKILYKKQKEFIIWPSTVEARRENVNRYTQIQGGNSFPGIVGCVDGTHMSHIAIPRQRNDNS